MCDGCIHATNPQSQPNSMNTISRKMPNSRIIMPTSRFKTTTQSFKLPIELLKCQFHLPTPIYKFNVVLQALICQFQALK